MFTKTDLLVSHEVPMARNKRLRLELNVLNLFNQKTARHVFNYLNRGAGVPRASSAIDLHDVDLFEGLRLRRDDQGHSQWRERVRSALRPGRPVRSLAPQGQVSVKYVF